MFCTDPIGQIHPSRKKPKYASENREVQIIAFLDLFFSVSQVVNISTAINTPTSIYSHAGFLGFVNWNSGYT
ncbi:hypothetical protein ES705_27369 [subsurface metagenome]